jgi:hypothetical protein
MCRWWCLPIVLAVFMFDVGCRKEAAPAPLKAEPGKRIPKAPLPAEVQPQ